MKQVQLINNFSKITTPNSSTNNVITKEVSKNIDENLKNIKSIKKLLLINPKISQQNKSNQTDNHLNMKISNKKILKNFSTTTNKLYHSSLSCLSYSNVSNDRTKINRNLNNTKKEKIIVLQFKNKFDQNSLGSSNGIYLHNLFKEKNEKKIKKSFSNNDLNYIKYINKKKIRFNHLRNIKRKNISYMSSNAISNDLINNYENFMITPHLNEKGKKLDDIPLKKRITKNKNKLKYYSFNDIINGLTRNINIVNTSNSKELHLKLLRKIDELVKFPSISNIKQEENLDSDKNIKTYSSNNKLNKKIEKIDIEKDRYLLSDNYNNIKEFLDQTNTKINSMQKSDIKKNLFLNQEEDEIDKADLIEDLKFLGNTNKLNWNLISEDDKKRGVETWKKIINLKKDVGINCQLNKEDFQINMKKIPQIKTPKESIKHIIFMSEEKKTNDHPRKTIILKLRKRYEPIKLNNSSSIKANSTFKIGPKNNFNNSNKSNNNKDKFNKILSDKIKPILSEKNIKSRYSYIKTNYKIINKLKNNEIKRHNEIKPENIKQQKNIEDLILDRDSNLDIISEEGKSNKMDSTNKYDGSYHEINEEDEEYKTDNKEILNELKLNLKSNELLNNKNFVENIIQNNTIKEKLISEDNKEEPVEYLSEKKTEEDNKEQKEEEKKDDIDNFNKIKEEKNEKEEENIEKNQNETDEDDLEERKKRYEKSRKLYLAEKYNRELLLRRLRKEKKKPKQKKLSLYELVKELSNSNKSKDISHLNKIKKRKYFININSIQDINKRKMEILLRLKRDLEYKLITGMLKSSEKLNFKEFVKKINSTTIDSLDEESLNEYLDKLEEYFNSFENDIINIEKIKKNEERINAFKQKLIDNLNYTEQIRENKSRIVGNAIDFNSINHINELSFYNNIDTENIKQANS